MILGWSILGWSILGRCGAAEGVEAAEGGGEGVGGDGGPEDGQEL